MRFRGFLNAENGRTSQKAALDSSSNGAWGRDEKELWEETLREEREGNLQGPFSPDEIAKQVVGKKNGLSNAMIADTSLRGVLDVVAKQNGQASHAASCVNTPGDQSMEELGLNVQTRFISFQGRYVDEGTGEHRSMCVSFKGDVEGKALSVRAAKRWYELVATCQSEAVDYMSQYRQKVTDARFRELVESAQAEYAEDSAMFDDIADEVISLGGRFGSQLMEGVKGESARAS